MQLQTLGPDWTSRWPELARLVSVVCLLGCVGWVSGGQQPPEEPPEYLLIPKEFPKGWVLVSAEVGPNANAVWQVNREQEPKDAVLVCLGKPDGYIRTEKAYENFELGLEWRFPSDPNGNSGILLHTVEKDMIWPKSIQIQLHRPAAGSVFPNGGAKTDNTLTAKDLSKPLDEWNRCLITSDRGKITVVMNGSKVGEVTGCMPQKGAIGLQSEGSEIHFRKIWIRPIK